MEEWRSAEEHMHAAGWLLVREGFWPWRFPHPPAGRSE